MKRYLLMFIILLVALLDLAIKLGLRVTFVGERTWQDTAYSLVFLYHGGSLASTLAAVTVTVVPFLALSFLRRSAPVLEIALWCVALATASRLLDCGLWSCAGVDWIGLRIASGRFVAFNFNDMLLWQAGLATAGGILQLALDRSAQRRWVIQFDRALVRLGI